MIANLSYQANVAILTLNRPEAMNALNGEMIQRIGELIDEVHKSEAKALIVVGAGEKAFCAGADVKGILGKDLAQQKEFARKGQHVFAQLDQLSIPSIAVISGVAFGGGLELAMACTFRVATSKARMGLPEIKLGLIPGYGGTQRLPRLIGAARALEIISTGRVVGAEEAERIGLVNRVVDSGDPVEVGINFSNEIGIPLPASFAMARKAVAMSLDSTLLDGLEIEAGLFAASTHSKDAQEGITAFLEKRKPVFVGQ